MVTGSSTYSVVAAVEPWAGGGYHPATAPEPAHGGYVWRALLHPEQEGTINITASDGIANHTTSISNVVFGDVFFCSVSVHDGYCTLIVTRSRVPSLSAANHHGPGPRVRLTSAVPSAGAK
jgi:hypothetical protein